VHGPESAMCQMRAETKKSFYASGEELDKQSIWNQCKLTKEEFSKRNEFCDGKLRMLIQSLRNKYYPARAGYFSQLIRVMTCYFIDRNRYTGQKFRAHNAFLNSNCLSRL
jgi:hypothetical protein